MWEGVNGWVKHGWVDKRYMRWCERVGKRCARGYVIGCVRWHALGCVRGYVLSYLILFYPILSCPMLSYPILTYPILSCLVLSYPILS